MSSKSGQTRQKSIGLIRESQIENYEDAKKLVQEDIGEDITEGEVVEHLAKAYLGLL